MVSVEDGLCNQCVLYTRVLRSGIHVLGPRRARGGRAELIERLHHGGALRHVHVRLDLLGRLHPLALLVQGPRTLEGLAQVRVLEVLNLDAGVDGPDGRLADRVARRRIQPAGWALLGDLGALPLALRVDDRQVRLRVASTLTPPTLDPGLGRPRRFSVWGRHMAVCSDLPYNLPRSHDSF